ncbi:hypothetical protein BDV93DRAFT_516267 [Ceratobasidium sp. AG-I]|nr:hypothetical protein BDV93DRAFT_516267 [Ceratobasidium sp. AG-I]
MALATSIRADLGERVLTRTSSSALARLVATLQLLTVFGGRLAVVWRSFGGRSVVVNKVHFAAKSETSGGTLMLSAHVDVCQANSQPRPPHPPSRLVHLPRAVIRDVSLVLLGVTRGLVPRGVVDSSRDGPPLAVPPTLLVRWHAYNFQTLLARNNTGYIKLVTSPPLTSKANKPQHQISKPKQIRNKLAYLVRSGIICPGINAGHSHAKIKRNTNLSHGFISKIRSKHRPDLKMSAGGCPPKLSPTAVRHAVRLVTNCNSISTAQATQTLCDVSGVSIHPQTVRRALKEAGLKPVKTHLPRAVIRDVSLVLLGVTRGLVPRGVVDSSRDGPPLAVPPTLLVRWHAYNFQTLLARNNTGYIKLVTSPPLTSKANKPQLS